MSPSCERITGYPPDTFIKDPAFMDTIIIDEDRPQWDAHHERIKAGAVDLCSFRIVRKDGEIRWMEHTCQPVNDERGNFLGTRGSNCDITGRIEAEEKLKESEQKFRAAFSDSQAAISIVTLKEARYIDVNTEFLRIAESTREEIIGKTADELDFWANEEQRRQMYGELSAHGRLNSFEIQVRSKSGKILTLLISADRTIINGEACLVSSILDITGRKKAADALRESKAKLEAVFESMTDAVFISDLDGNLIDLNEAFANFHRFGSKAECYRKLSEYPDYIDVFLPDGTLVPPDMWVLQRALRGETAINAEYILVRKDTRESWWGSYGFGPVTDNEGKTVGSVVVARDITAGKAVQEKLRKSEEKYRLLYENMAQGVVFQQADGKVIFVNPAAEEILGVTQEQLKNPAVIDANVQMYNEDGSVSPADEHPTMRALRTGQEVRDAQFRIFNPRQKAWRSISVNATPLFKPGERKPFEAFVTISDVTERVKLIESIKESEARYRTLFEKTGNPILVIDTEENYIEGNDAALEFLECNREELLTHKVTDFHPSGQTTNRSIWKTGGKMERQYEIKGRIKTLELTITPGTWKGRPAVFGIGTDITERKRLGDANIRALAEWQNTFDSISDMVSIQDRDFRLVKVNRAYAEAFHTTADKLVGKHCYEVIHRTDCPVRNCPHTRTLQEGAAFTEEIFEPSLGAYLQVSTSPTLDEKGNVTGCVHIAKDISESKMAEASILDKEKMLRSMINAITESACLMDEEGTILENNECIAKRLSQEETGLKGKNIYGMLPPDVAEYRRSMVRKAIETRSYIQFEDVRAGRNILNSVYPVQEDNKEVHRVAIFGLDLTAVRQADQKIRESEQRSAAAFNIHQDPMAITELETGRIIDVNPAYSEWSGYSREELIGKSTRDLGMFVNTGDRDKFVEQVRCGNSVTNMEVQLRIKNGEVRDTLFSASTVEMGGKILLFTHARDITERLRTLKALEGSEKQYRLLAENTDDVIWTLSHDLHFTYVSPSVRRLRGLEPEEAMAETLEECMTPASWQKALKEIELYRPFLVNGIDKTWRIEVEQYHKNGSTIWMESVLRPLYNNAGKFDGLI
ncbi:MAG: PAS domain S-box protein, partial [Dehalococcoidia bacterium]